MFYWLSKTLSFIFDSYLILGIVCVICGIFALGYVISKNTIK